MVVACPVSIRLSIGALETHIDEILLKIQTFHWGKFILKCLLLSGGHQSVNHMIMQAHKMLYLFNKKNV